MRTNRILPGRAFLSVEDFMIIPGNKHQRSIWPDLEGDCSGPEIRWVIAKHLYVALEISN
jgi:hypothetical protein